MDRRPSHAAAPGDGEVQEIDMDAKTDAPNQDKAGDAGTLGNLGELWGTL